MARLWRWLMLIVVAVAVSLALVLVITYRNMGEMSQMEVQARWLSMLMTKAPIAQTLQQWWGNQPPLKVQTLAVVWQRADVTFWWWLPLVVIAVRIFVGGFARRRS